MNLLERKAMKKAAKHIEPYLDRGEALMEFDIGRVPMGQVALLATNMAVYICPLPLSGAPLRSPYENMAGAERLGKLLLLRSYGGTDLFVDLGPGRRALADIVVHHVAQAVLIRQATEQREAMNTTAKTRGTFVPLLLGEQHIGGDGEFRITSGEPIFVTDDGYTHSYGWDCYQSWKPTGDGFALTIVPGRHTVLLHTLEPEKWTRLLLDAGVQRVD